MLGYYTQKLAAERLRLCYEIASPRVKRYLAAEIEFVLTRIKATDRVLELGCGYGRVLQKLAAKANYVVGIDTSRESLLLAQNIQECGFPCYLLEMDAARLALRECSFDVVVCIQNGISAFKADQRQLIEEAVRVTRAGGIVLFSSYAEQFWENRLEWFRRQAGYGLVGEIDENATGDGVIICKDGFRATTVGPADFVSLTARLGITPQFHEVDGSSIFCEIRKE